MTALLPRRALRILAEFCNLKLQGLTCRARTAKSKVCKHKRPNGELFCKQHSKMYSRKVAYLASLHNLRGSKMQFGECLAIFGEVVKTGNLGWASTPFVCSESPIKGGWEAFLSQKSFSPFDKAMTKQQNLEAPEGAHERDMLDAERDGALLRILTSQINHRALIRGRSRQQVP